MKAFVRNAGQWVSATWKISCFVPQKNWSAGPDLRMPGWAYWLIFSMKSNCCTCYNQRREKTPVNPGGHFEQPIPHYRSGDLAYAVKFLAQAPGRDHLLLFC